MRARVLALGRGRPVTERGREYILRKVSPERRAEIREWLDSLPEPDPEFGAFWSDPSACPDRPHRGPEGPNEDLGQCPKCLMPSWSKRPEGETFGCHLPDCSLPVDHESFCVGGGSGHPPSRKVRGLMSREHASGFDCECHPPAVGLVHAAHAGNRLCSSPDYVALLKRIGQWPSEWRRRQGVTCRECLALMDGEV